MKIMIRCGLVAATLAASSVLTTSCFAQSTLTVRKYTPYKVGFRHGYRMGYGSGYAAGTVAPYKVIGYYPASYYYPYYNYGLLGGLFGII